MLNLSCRHLYFSLLLCFLYWDVHRIWLYCLYFQCVVLLHVCSQIGVGVLQFCLFYFIRALSPKCFICVVKVVKMFCLFGCVLLKLLTLFFRDKRKMQISNIGYWESWRRSQSINRKRVWAHMGGAIKGLLPWQHTLHAIEGRKHAVHAAPIGSQCALDKLYFTMHN